MVTTRRIKLSFSMKSLLIMMTGFTIGFGLVMARVEHQFACHNDRASIRILQSGHHVDFCLLRLGPQIPLDPSHGKRSGAANKNLQGKCVAEKIRVISSEQLEDSTIVTVKLNLIQKFRIWRAPEVEMHRHYH